ncbi:hypothetical protein [Mycolicibacterium palauense]|uniref:hypothetical protein n=1 Tax=Mycolicibacterium palauense TaxID=2034511 RepID=UPI000BFEE703|nr:hypothetical protein [Mycolicibacterium palauense]
MAIDPKTRGSVNKVFGEGIPQASSDERDPDAAADEESRENWLRDNRPPHHE